jgi:hypothetical protein
LVAEIVEAFEKIRHFEEATDLSGIVTWL